MAFPSSDSVIRQPLGSSGSLGLVPHLHGYYWLLRLPAVHPALLRFLRLAVPLCARLFVSPGNVGTPSPGRGSLVCGFPNHCSDGGNVRVSQVPRGPPACMPCSPTPVGPSDPAISILRYCLPLIQRRRLPRFAHFRGSITRPAGSLSTLRRVGHPSPRKTRFWLLASFARRGWLPAGSHCEVSVRLCHRFLLAQALPGALNPVHLWFKSVQLQGCTPGPD